MWEYKSDLQSVKKICRDGPKDSIVLKLDGILVEVTSVLVFKDCRMITKMCAYISKTNNPLSVT